MTGGARPNSTFQQVSRTSLGSRGVESFLKKNSFRYIKYRLCVVVVYGSGLAQRRFRRAMGYNSFDRCAFSSLSLPSLLSTFPPNRPGVYVQVGSHVQTFLRLSVFFFPQSPPNWKERFSLNGSPFQQLMYRYAVG